MVESSRKILTLPELKKSKPNVNKNQTRVRTGNSTSVHSKESVKSKAPEPETLAIKADSLAFSLVGAAQAVAYVLEGVALPQALSRVLTQMDASPQARGAMQDIAYRTMRQVGRVDALIALMTSKPPEPPLLYGLMCCALTLLATENADEAPYDDFVVVDQAVNAAASSTNMVFAKGMVNAVLRRFLREKAELLPVVLKQAAARWNYPQWWVDQCKTAYPQDWQKILAAADTPPPMTLRVNQRLSTVEDYLQLLQQEQIESTQIGPFAVRLHKPVPVQNIPGFSSGVVSVQDAAAQLAAVLLDVQDGHKVLDACAAPGGKTSHILELAKVNLLALDVDAKRLDKIHENLARLQLFATIKEGDASWSNWWDGQQFDRILADVPCTASGVVRRHPDIRWLRRKTDAAQLAVTSNKILDNLWRMLKPGGKLLLATCSIWPIESEKQAQDFASKHGAILLDAPGQLLPTSEINNEHDGLFYALFQKPAV
ncbi:16S rRNA (cytosine(967)-C(5))-methyltransferase RsmB [Undibacterium flavidum]|uniref:16S rRNA (cytosine(967)-C(5))-methyltransferase n=1 Tax=Undibacterium flavidum TaxID=2762297 RepID=A0ABR6YA84_9BURK|nr:16S rRNA (cytosine(967)-C(5))-methyltransferase RsmB [Undibacterium flavidum]MBC3873515.1 16S rRNA (cytosine(967)-C(5))-methyltransferase RsmB [Undibacterium flavidum]